MVFELEVERIQSHFRKMNVVTTYSINQLARLTRVKMIRPNRRSLGNDFNNPDIKLSGTTTR